MRPPKFEARGSGDHAIRYQRICDLITEELNLIRAACANDDDVVEQSHDFAVAGQISRVEARIPQTHSWRIAVRPHGAKQHKVYTPTDDGHILIHTYENDRVVDRLQTGPNELGCNHLQDLHAILFDFGEAAAEG